jgi:hypothetical protein
MADARIRDLEDEVEKLQLEKKDKSGQSQKTRWWPW